MQRAERTAMKKTFAIFFSPGPAWIAGKTSREQSYWTEHAAFMDKLFDDGTVILGGPYADYTGLLVIVEALHEEEVYKLFGDDPFVVNEIVRISSVHQSRICLDARHEY